MCRDTKEISLFFEYQYCDAVLAERNLRAAAVYCHVTDRTAFNESVARNGDLA